MDVTIIYFKPNGKYYTQESFYLALQNPWDVHKHMRRLRYEGNLPGLTKNSREFIMLVIAQNKNYEPIPQLLLLDGEDSRYADFQAN